MKSKTEILKERLSEIRDTLLELEFIKKDIKTLINSTKEDRKETLQESQFFYRLYRNYIRLFVIDIFKLIGKKEDHNIQKLLEFCKINLRKIEWFHPISLEKLNSLTDKLSSISEKFEQIEGLRNKYYAHNDKKKNSFNYQLSLMELSEVLEGLQNIFSELNVEFDNHQWLFDIQYTSPDIMHTLNKYKQLRKLTLKEYGENKSSVETKTLLDIIRSK